MFTIVEWLSTKQIVVCSLTSLFGCLCVCQSVHSSKIFIACINITTIKINLVRNYFLVTFCVLKYPSYWAYIFPDVSLKLNINDLMKTMNSPYFLLITSLMNFLLVMHDALCFLHALIFDDNFLNFQFGK